MPRIRPWIVRLALRSPTYQPRGAQISVELGLITCKIAKIDADQRTIQHSEGRLRGILLGLGLDQGLTPDISLRFADIRVDSCVDAEEQLKINTRLTNSAKIRSDCAEIRVELGRLLEDQQRCAEIQRQDSQSYVQISIRCARMCEDMLRLLVIVLQIANYCVRYRQNCKVVRELARRCA